MEDALRAHSQDQATRTAKPDANRAADLSEDVSFGKPIVRQPTGRGSSASITSVADLIDEHPLHRVVTVRAQDDGDLNGHSEEHSGRRRGSLTWVYIRLGIFKPRSLARPGRGGAFRLVMVPPLLVLAMTIARSTPDERIIGNHAAQYTSRQWVVLACASMNIVAAACLVLAVLFYRTNANACHQALVVAQLHNFVIMLLIAGATVQPRTENCPRCRDLVIGLTSIAMAMWHVLTIIAQTSFIVGDVENFTYHSSFLAAGCISSIHFAISLIIHLNPTISGTQQCAPHQMLTFPSLPVAACKYTCMRTNLTCARANSMLVLFQLCVCCNQSVAPRARDQSRAGGAARRTLSARVDAKQLAVQSDANSLLTRLPSPYFPHASSPPSRNQPCCHYSHAVAAGCPTPVFAGLNKEARSLDLLFLVPSALRGSKCASGRLQGC